MLVITRYADESIRIGNDIIVHVLEKRGPRTKLGIEAPRDIRILRSELEAGANVKPAATPALAVAANANSADD